MSKPVRKSISVPAPVINSVKLIVLEDLRLGDVVYSKGHTIEVFYHEAAKLLSDYPDHFDPAPPDET